MQEQRFTIGRDRGCNIPIADEFWPTGLALSQDRPRDRVPDQHETLPKWTLQESNPNWLESGSTSGPTATIATPAVPNSMPTDSTPTSPASSKYRQ